MACSDQQPQLTLLTRVGCHLCVDAEKVLAQLSEELAVPWRRVDVDSDPDLRAEYGDRVPVLLLNNVEHSFWRIDQARLRRDLQ